MTQINIDTSRLDHVNKLSLKNGAHDPQEVAKRVCVMEAVAYVAGEKWSDSPECACPVIASFMRSWNDGLPTDADRNRLLRGFIPRLVGSRSTNVVQLKRSYMALDWFARVYTPAFLELAGFKDHADLCRNLVELTNDVSCEAANSVLSAAESAARSAAESAARSAAESAARSAARSAAWSAAESAARSAAWSALTPTVETLQASAIELVERMLAVTE
jgi:hypothetical protein